MSRPGCRIIQIKPVAYRDPDRATTTAAVLLSDFQRRNALYLYVDVLLLTHIHDGTSGPGADTVDATFLALRAEFLEDAADDLKTLLSYLNEAVSGIRSMAGCMKIDAVAPRDRRDCPMRSP